MDNSLARIIRFIARHPLTEGRALSGVLRFVRWQIACRFRSEHVHRWIGGARLVVRRGMRGATGNIYVGLHEFSDMAFLLHLLKEGDLFLDIGSNVGTYTVLASAVCGARSISFEPDAQTVRFLCRNLAENGIESLVDVRQTALGDSKGTLRFTQGRDTVNKVAEPADPDAILVEQDRLENIPGATGAVLLKLDVEGHERAVFEGAGAVLSSPSLLAVETETTDVEIERLLTDAGFVRRWYDPFARSLSPEPILRLKASNALYVRGEADIMARVSAAPLRSVVGRAF